MRIECRKQSAQTGSAIESSPFPLPSSKHVNEHIFGCVPCTVTSFLPAHVAYRVVNDKGLSAARQCLKKVLIEHRLQRNTEQETNTETDAGTVQYEPN